MNLQSFPARHHVILRLDDNLVDLQVKENLTLKWVSLAKILIHSLFWSIVEPYESEAAGTKMVSFSFFFLALFSSVYSFLLLLLIIIIVIIIIVIIITATAINIIIIIIIIIIMIMIIIITSPHPPLPPFFDYWWR